MPSPRTAAGEIANIGPALKTGSVMSGNWLFNINLWMLFFIGAAILFVSTEIGRWFGRRQGQTDKAKSHSVVTLESTALGLVTLMISFTFSVALDRYDVRKKLVMEEANAIATADLRAATLPAPFGPQIKPLLRSYLDTRLSIQGMDQYGLRRISERSLAIQDRLWQIATEVSTQNPRSVQAGLFAQALTDLFDIHEKRLTADRNHVPQAVFLLLFGLGCVAMGLVGYDAGLAGRARLPAAIMGALFALVIVQIDDLDRPMRGLILVQQTSLEALQGSLK
jgi:hypothetical protein